MKKIISTKFNVAATFAVLLVNVIFTVFTTDVSTGYESNTLIDLFFTQLWLKILFSLLLLVGFAITISYIFKEFWNRLLCDLFQVREVNLNEAYAISILLVSLLVI